MTGTRRVVLFCVLVVFIPAILLIAPLYIKNTIYGEVIYEVKESDVLEITDGISNIFCSAHRLKMNDSFSAFQVSRKPETTSYRKHIRLKKSMILPDDTLEYWGFYLLKGATVALSVCSRFHGASILVIKGERTLRTCGLLDHNKNKALTSGIYLPEADHQVKIIFESHAQEIYSDEFGLRKKEPPQNDTHPIKANETFHRGDGIGTNKDDFAREKVTDNGDALQMLETSTGDLSNGTNPWNVTEDAGSIDYSSTAGSIAKNKSEEVNATGYDVENNSIMHKKLKLKALEEELRMVREDIAKEENVEDSLEIKNVVTRKKRNYNPQSPPVVLDQGIQHGGNNAVKNVTGFGDDSSISSFENGLLTCYNGNVLISQEFEPSEKCVDVNYLMTGKHMQIIHDVKEEGYYYYMFYSDNDIVSNVFHAVFNIFKPTLQYENVTQKCINQTECFFNLNLFSNDSVIVEIPTRDGIDNEVDDNFWLISQCYPRMEVYAIFQIAIIFFILGCAFI